MTVFEEVVVIIVGFRNADDIRTCVDALVAMHDQPSFEIIVAENGGASSFYKLTSALSSFCDAGGTQPFEEGAGVRIGGAALQRSVSIRRGSASPIRLHLACMSENLGYGGAINACLRSLDAEEGWQAVWVLNPDTKPTPSALAELASYALLHECGMVGSRICLEAQPDRVRTCGLKWLKLRGHTGSVGCDQASTLVGERADDIARWIDAPSGASIYATRSLINRIGLLDESYFLYFEDLAWGLQARKAGRLGYAHQSVVMHEGGTTIGSSRTRAGSSYLATYLEYRNRVHFVRKFFPGWLPWTLLMQLVHLSMFLRDGAFRNFVAAARGLIAGIKGQTGRPDAVLARHLASAPARRLPTTLRKPEKAAPV